MASNPYVNKVQLADNTVLIDLTSDTVTADVLLSGYTAHDASGALITGAMSGGSVIITDTTDEHGGTIRHISTTGSTLDGKSADDVVISGTTVTVPAGIYAIDAVKTITGVTLTAPSSGTKTFSITVPNGNTTATFVFNVDTSGNVTITES